MKLLLVRHPAAEVASGICYGRLDVGLRAGPATAELVAAVARHRVEVVWSSPATRCLLPARAMSASPRIDARLQELDFGAWEGTKWADVSRQELDRWAADPLGFAPPDGETGGALITRVTECFRDIVAAGEDCAVISHGGPLRVLLALARNEPVDLLASTPPVGAVIAVNYPPAD